MRDTQGAVYYAKDKVVVMSEHGPTGGDEINALTYDEIVSEKEINFGWPTANIWRNKIYQLKKINLQSRTTTQKMVLKNQLSIIHLRLLLVIL